MSLKSLIWNIIIGVFSYVAQDTMSIALISVKSGTVAGFYNLGLVISFLTDAFYFGRQMVWSDYAGTIIIIVCTSL